jgi:hypothetical protein
MLIVKYEEGKAGSSNGKSRNRREIGKEDRVSSNRNRKIGGLTLQLARLQVSPLGGAL